MKLNDTILVALSTVNQTNITYTVRNISGELQVDVFKPATPEKKEIKAIMVNVKQFLSQKQGYDCPDFVMLVTIADQTVFNDSTNGMCSVPVTFASNLSIGQNLAVSGKPAGYTEIKKTVTLTTTNIADLAGNGL